MTKVQVDQWKNASWLRANGPRCELTISQAKHDNWVNSYKINYGGYMIILACGILGIVCYKKSEVNIQIKTESWVSSNSTQKQRVHQVSRNTKKHLKNKRTACIDKIWRCSLTYFLYQSTGKFLNIRTTQKFAIITQKFEKDGFTKEKCTQKMQPELQTV